MAADPRDGKTLVVRKRRLPFSFFPVIRNTRRWGLGDALFAMSPWAVMASAIKQRGDIAVGELVSEYQAAVDSFHNWFGFAVAQRNVLLLKTYDRQRRELVEYEQSLFGSAFELADMDS